MKDHAVNPKRFINLVLVFTSFIASAQVIRIDSTSNWRKSFKVGINLNQASFSNNWKAGGVNSIGFNSLLNYKAGYKKDKNSWDNEVDLIYGMVKNEGQGYRKTLDRLYLDTKYGRNFSKNWDMFLALNFLTQFARGYQYVKDVNGVEQASLISNLLAPAFITTSIGFDYHPNEFFKVRLSPLAPRVTIVKNSQDYIAADSVAPYGVAIGETLRYEWLAAQVLAEFNKDIATHLNLKWRYLMFANYEQLEFKQIDHRLDIGITAKVNNFINVSLSGILLYDYDQDNEVQLTQSFSLGVLYAFQNFENK